VGTLFSCDGVNVRFCGAEGIGMTGTGFVCSSRWCSLQNFGKYCSVLTGLICMVDIEKNIIIHFMGTFLNDFIVLGFN
jgi:hypothetical protein